MRRMKGAGHLRDRKHEMHIRKESTIVGNILMEFLDIPYVIFPSEHQKWNTVTCGFTALSIETVLRSAVRLSLPRPSFFSRVLKVKCKVHPRTGNEGPVGE
jgi:hypothetical protein